MAETFPVAFARIDLKPAGNLIHAREKSGLLIVGRNTDRPWSGSLVTDKLSQAEYADLFGLILKAEDRNLRFDFVHPRFAVPRCYTPATWPIETDAELEEVTSPSSIVVSGLPIGLQLMRGDRFTIIQNDRRGYSVLPDDVTVASTTAQAIPVAPRLPLGVFAPGAAVRFRNPMVRLAIVPGSSDMSEEYRPTPISIEVTEALI